MDASQYVTLSPGGSSSMSDDEMTQFLQSMFEEPVFAAADPVPAAHMSSVALGNHLIDPSGSIFPTTLPVRTSSDIAGTPQGDITFPDSPGVYVTLPEVFIGPNPSENPAGIEIPDAPAENHVMQKIEEE